MERLNINEMIKIIRKNIVRIIAASMTIGILTFIVASCLQTYTCVLGFKYNNEGAKEGLGLDGETKLDPYEIQNPIVIQAALDRLKIDRKKVDVKGIRQNIAISKVVTGLDSEVSKSAALLGEKVEVPATEFEMKLKYKAALGEKFGTKMFSAIINEYDEFLINKYYNKNAIADFAKIVKDSSADYIDIADIMGSEIDNISQYFYDLGESYPDFRSTDTGYSFTEVADLYTNLRNIQHAKYYGNIRQGNLAKDPELVIKSYSTKAKDLEETERTSFESAENYKNSIVTFYDPYKAAGLYRQAENVQTNADSSNNRDKEVLDNYDVERYKNTYDDIVTKYVDNAVQASNACHTKEYYRTIVASFENDTVDPQTKQRLLEANEGILEEIAALSADYCEIANATLKELYDQRVTSDLQYLIVPEVITDIPVNLITVFITVLAFGLIIIFIVFANVFGKFMEQQKELDTATNDEAHTDKKVIETEGLSELEALVYDQYLHDFKEFYLVYQSMEANKKDATPHMETFIRWKSGKVGSVSPERIIQAISKLGLFNELNAWIFQNVAEDIAKMGKANKQFPIVHINCPKSELGDFIINDLILECTHKHHIPASCFCLELSGEQMTEMLEEIVFTKGMGVQICIDRFENSDEDNEIIAAVEPDYIKMSLDALNYDMYATSEDDYRLSALSVASYMLTTINKCHEKGIEVCICGVETKEQDEQLSKLFDYKQGYYYSKPEKLEF